MSCSRRFTFRLIAETSNRFSDFAPYVPSINDLGQLAIRVSLASGAPLIVRADPVDPPA